LILENGKRRERETPGIRAGEEALLSSALESVQELNGRCLSLLQKTAREQPGGIPRRLGSLVPQFRELDARGIASMARLPFLLVDFGFGKPKLLGELLARAPSQLRFPPPRGSFPGQDATALARGVLILAQAVCRYHPAHAGVLLGLDSSLQARVARLRLPDLERLAEDNPHFLRLRWEDQVGTWQRLLKIADSTDPAVHHEFRLYGLQLIAGSLSVD